MPAGDQTGPVSANIPSLVMHGDHDGVSSLEGLKLVERMLPGATIVAVPYEGHDVFGTYYCLRASRNDWLEDPTSAPDFDQCLETIEPPIFD